jgi:hypothetical protein
VFFGGVTGDCQIQGKLFHYLGGFHQLVPGKVVSRRAAGGGSASRGRRAGSPDICDGQCHGGRSLVIAGHLGVERLHIAVDLVVVGPTICTTTRHRLRPVLAGVGLLWLLLGLSVAAPGCASVGAIVGVILWLLIVTRVVALGGVLLPGPLLGVSANRGQSNTCTVTIGYQAVRPLSNIK